MMTILPFMLALDVIVEDFVSSTQNSLFQGYTFFLTQKQETYTSMFTRAMSVWTCKSCDVCRFP